MSPAASWTLVSIVVGLPGLVVYCCLILAGREAELERRYPLHTHTCTRCGRIQRWQEPFDQFSPCRACQLAMPSLPIELDLDDFADAEAIRVHLDGAEPIYSSSPRM